MNVVEIKGGRKKQRELAESMINYCIKKLMPRMRTLYIDVNLNKKCDALGYCLALDNREFELEIQSDQSLRRFLETVAHEMVHVKQYARGELYESTAQNKHKWQGEWLDKDPEYYDRPWEIEAHGREVGLFVRWAKEAGYANADWAQDKG